jgi:N4-gp56 family major capsid protein
MAAETTSTLSNEMMTLYSKVFLKRNKFEQIYEEGGQKQTRSQNEGKSILFNRYTPLAAATTPLTEGSNPTEVSIASGTVTATLSEFGTTVKIGRFLSLTSVDVRNKEKIALIGQNMRETMDTIVRTELDNFTARLAGGKTLISDVAATDVYSATEIRKAVRALEAAYARKYADGMFIAKVQPYTKADLLNDSTWIAAKEYSDVKDLYRGEMGELYGVRHLLSANGKTTTSTTTVYHNYIHGADAFGVYDLDGDQPKLYIVPNTAVDSGNPAGRFSLASWAGSFCSKILVQGWGIVLKTGATA